MLANKVCKEGWEVWGGGGGGGGGARNKATPGLL